MKNQELQVSPEHYSFERYVHEGRWDSYRHQIQEIIATKPGSVLEIGSGDGVVASYLRQNTNTKYSVADIDETRKPDVVAPITKLPGADNSFDTVCAFQVLEHIPFEDFETGVDELFRVASKYVLISLPHFGPQVKFLCKIPFLPEIRFAFKIPFAKKHVFNGEHYWEVGKRRYSPEKIRNILQKHGDLEKEYVPFLNQYHRFYVLKKK